MRSQTPGKTKGKRTPQHLTPTCIELAPSAVDSEGDSKEIFAFSLSNVIDENVCGHRCALGLKTPNFAVLSYVYDSIKVGTGNSKNKYLLWLRLVEVLGDSLDFFGSGAMPDPSVVTRFRRWGMRHFQLHSNSTPSLTSDPASVTALAIPPGFKPNWAKTCLNHFNTTAPDIFLATDGDGRNNLAARRCELARIFSSR